MKNKNHRTFVEKSWGSEDWIANSPLYCGKRMVLWKGYKCSFHKHSVKTESFYIEQGKMLLRYGFDDDISKSTEVILSAGDSFDVPVGMRHQFEGLEETVFFEFSTEHFENDSIRITLGGKV